jgi:hypothetical protein
MQAVSIDPCTLPPHCEALRAEVRAFVAETLRDFPANLRVRNWSGGSPEFSAKLGGILSLFCQSKTIECIDSLMDSRLSWQMKFRPSGPGAGTVRNSRRR